MRYRLSRLLPVFAAAAVLQAQDPQQTQPAPALPGPASAASQPTVQPPPTVPVQTQPNQPSQAPQPTGAPSAPPGADSVNMQFPRTSIFEILTTYEALTGKKLIRDSNLAGPELSIMVSQPVTRQEAIKLIESSLLLNGYAIVPVDDKTVKILGPGRAPRTEGLPLYTESKSLPDDGDRVVSFYKPLSFISPEEAITVLQGVVQTNAFGMLAAVPNTNAVIITDKTPVIRKALGVLALIDVEPAQVVTEFVPLLRANAEKVVEILDQMFGKDDPASKSTGPTTTTPAAPPGPDGQPAAAGATGARYENRLIAGKAKFLADKRTNRILVVTRQENYRFVRDVITQLDSAGNFDQPYVRVLNYVPVNDIFSVVSDMLAEADSEKQGGGSAGTQPTPANPFGNNSSQGTGTSSGSSSGSAGLSKPDRLSNESAQAAPQSATIGEIKLIGDNSSNSIIVFGPPESKQRAKQILDLLDQRPKQVYLAVVIGQLRLSEGVDYGVNGLIRYQGASGNGIAAAILNPLLSAGGNTTLPIASQFTSPAALNNGLNSIAGLTIFGTIANSVDVYAKFLESTNRFRTLSRPVIYTTNNRKATILSGQKVPVPTSTLTTATGGGINNNGSAVTSNIQYQDVVLKLEVIPLINSDREVNLVIAQTNDNIIGSESISGNNVPVISTQELTTSVRVPNGSTIVLGGLITEDKTKDQTGIPYISKIPVIGSLLGGRTNNKVEKKELVVMIQPIVVDSNNEMMKASAYEGDRSRLGQDAQQMTAPLAEQAREPGPWKPAPTPVPKSKKR